VTEETVSLLPEKAEESAGKAVELVCPQNSYKSRAGPLFFKNKSFHDDL